MRLFFFTVVAAMNHKHLPCSSHPYDDDDDDDDDEDSNVVVVVEVTLWYTVEAIPSMAVAVGGGDDGSGGSVDDKSS